MPGEGQGPGCVCAGVAYGGVAHVAEHAVHPAAMALMPAHPLCAAQPERSLLHVAWRAVDTLRWGSCCLAGICCRTTGEEVGPIRAVSQLKAMITCSLCRRAGAVSAVTSSCSAATRASQCLSGSCTRCRRAHQDQLGCFAWCLVMSSDAEAARLGQLGEMRGGCSYSQCQGDADTAELAPSNTVSCMT